MVSQSQGGGKGLFPLEYKSQPGVAKTQGGVSFSVLELLSLYLQHYLKVCFPCNLSVDFGNISFTVW